MEHFFQTVAAVLLTVVLGLVLSRQSRETAVLLSLGVCCMVAYAAVSFLSPVLEFWQTLRQVGELDGAWLEILMKAVGIGILSEVAALVCSDAGNGALGKAIGILSAAAMLWLALPLLRGVLELVENLLGAR